MHQLFVIYENNEGRRLYGYLGHVIQLQTLALIRRRLLHCNSFSHDLIEHAGGDTHGLVLAHHINELKHLVHTLSCYGRDKYHLSILHEGQGILDLFGELVDSLVVLLDGIPLVDGNDDALAPVMGDAGSMYAGFTPDFAVEMRKLCGKADVIAPNMTEVSLLLGIPYAEQCPLETVKTYLKQLTEIGCPIAVITGIRNGDQHGAIAYDSTTGSYYAAYREHVPEPMHGTGDIFASVLSGALVRGASIEQALSIAVNFTADTIQATLPDLRTLPREEAPWYGVEFEACIGNLVDYVKEIHS